VVLSVPADATYADSARYPNSSTFDGFRHYKLRQGGTPSDHARNQYVTTNESNLGWGYGNHACPGRFFAANEIKMMVVRLLLDFDIKMPGNQTKIWPQLEMGGRIVTDPSKTIMLRTREV
jgi:cytochrome P450